MPYDSVHVADSQVLLGKFFRFFPPEVGTL